MKVVLDLRFLVCRTVLPRWLVPGSYRVGHEVKNYMSRDEDVTIRYFAKGSLEEDIEVDGAVLV